MTGADELATFARQLSLQCPSEKTPPLDWPDAFLRLNGHLSPLVKADGYFDALIPFQSLLGL